MKGTDSVEMLGRSPVTYVQGFGLKVGRAWRVPYRFPTAGFVAAIAPFDPSGRGDPTAAPAIAGGVMYKFVVPVAAILAVAACADYGRPHPKIPAGVVPQAVTLDGMNFKVMREGGTVHVWRTDFAFRADYQHRQNTIRAAEQVTSCKVEREQFFEERNMSAQLACTAVPGEAN